MVNAVLTEEDKLILRTLAVEIVEIRKQLNQLAETLAKLNDKHFLKAFTDNKPDITEKQVDKYQLSLQKQVDTAENEFRY
ncbi:MAG: hypothetical protein M1540_04645 [Candidatus Bathyarchaeota archaeon]|nr:hypothetical protein [Candidatus Bathyarchaeota archaeon]